MAAVMDEYLESPMDSDDVFPCKGCGEILEEGKAFELAGNRWHLDCFRCNTCSTLLDSDANLLLLGDGSLICNNCTYSCTACGNKIEDLAILTGDQAFCATCFRCRNCKRKIENLRYARTSQGIFCMGCHETLMARRRKKSKAAAAAKSREKDQSPMITEKSLPALPPNAIPSNAFSNDRVDPESDTPTELSPKPRLSQMLSEPSSRGNSIQARSPERPSDPPAKPTKPEGLSLPTSTYRKNRNSAIIPGTGAITTESGDGYMISVALDPSPGPSSTATPRSATEQKKDKDYFSVSRPSLSEKRSDSHSSTPHIAFQEKGRQHSSDQEITQTKSAARHLSKSLEQEHGKSSPASDDFKLQDAPKNKKVPGSRSTSSQSSIALHDNSSNKSMNGAPRKDSAQTDSRRANNNVVQSRASQDLKMLDDDEIRISIESGSKPIPRKDVPPVVPRNANGKPGQSRRVSVSEEAPSTPRKQSTRPGVSESISETYMQPRTAPLPPAGQSQPVAGKGTPGTIEEHPSPKVSPKLPRWSSGGDFSLDEDMARILGTDEGSTSILRRVSNAVRHGRTGSIESSHNPPPSRGNHTRSISETTRTTASPRWSKTLHMDEANGHHTHEISNPVSLASADNPALLKRQLRNSEQRVAELERQFNTEKDLKNLNQKLIEKRKTVSVLDTQTEIMIRQLEVLSKYVERAKETKTPIDPRDLEESAVKEFVQKLENVKLAMSEEIENLHEERDQLMEEKNRAVADRDRALMEFEQLSSKNAQLADMNNDLTHQIQERFKSQIGNDSRSSNGLGIYSQGKGGTGSSINLDSSSITTGATLIAADEDPIVEHGPTVVQVRKGQVKKFNWKKGSKTMAQNVAKGVNRAVVAFQNDRERIQHQGQQGLAGDNIGLPYNMTIAQGEIPNVMLMNAQNKQTPQVGLQQQQYGFFGKKNAMPKSTSASTVATPAAVEPPSVLFGSDLSERCEYERRQIPNVVTRCIEEVELRGMDQEGIYRKTGGNSQVNMIKDGFDRDETFDISDPDYDITAVTSVLKQYFRRLPDPLLTFDVYEQILESNAIADEAERCIHLRKACTSMPQSHSDCLEFLMFHLHRVAQREPENLMSPKNLAVVFAPTIMRDLSIEREMTDMHAKNIAVQFMIENTNVIFED